jgi:hypothetical protein
MQISILATSLGTCHSVCEPEMLYVPWKVLQFVYRWQALLLLVYCRQFSIFIVEPGRIHPLIINTAILVYMVCTATRIFSLSNLLLCLCSFKYLHTALYPLIYFLFLKLLSLLFCLLHVIILICLLCIQTQLDCRIKTIHSLYMFLMCINFVMRDGTLLFTC